MSIAPPLTTGRTRPGHRPGPSRRAGVSSARRLLRRSLLLVAAALVAAPFLLPLYWLLRSSVMPNAEIYAWPPKMLPLPSLENLTAALSAAPFDTYLLNSVIVTGLGAGGNLVMATFTAYAFAFIPFPAKKALFLLLVGALMVPGHITLVVNYLVISEMGLVNSYLGLVLPGLSNAFGTFLLRQHFLTMPAEVLEAAELDGAGHLRKLIRFVVPMSLPAIVTVGLICVIGEWNSFVWPLIVITSDSMRTLPIGLMTLKDTEGLTNWGPIMAGTLMVALPMLIVYLIGHRQIITGLTGASMRS